MQLPCIIMEILSSLLCILYVVTKCHSTSTTDQLGHRVVAHRSLAPNNQVIMAFDSLLSDEAISSLGSFILKYVRWETGVYGSEHCRTNEQGGAEARHCQDLTSPELPWVGQIDPLWFSQTHTWRKLEEAVAYANKGSSPIFFPFSVRSEVLQRGDNVAPRVVASSPYSKEYALRIFLAPEWQMNDYGDMSFYDESLQNKTRGSKYDIALTVRPHPGRVVFWDASIPSLYRPPSMGFLDKLFSVSIQLTASKEKYEKACQDWKDWDEQKTMESKQSFPHLTNSMEKVNLDDHLVKQYSDTEGRKVSIYDDVFEEDHLEALRSYLVAHPSTNSLPYDLEAYELSDNACWIKTFDALEFPKSGAWEVLSGVAQHATRGQRKWFPYDVSLNVVRSGDHTRVHEDCETWEDEFTMVLYMNPDLGLGDYGETIFYNTKPHDLFSKKLYEGISMQDYDAFAAVDPKYGRVVIFDGLIPHSARPPSTGYTKPRYSFAVKLAVDRKTAITKRLRELIDEDDGLSEQDLLDDIVEAETNKAQLDRSEEWLERKYRELQQQLMEKNERNKQRLLQVI